MQSKELPDEALTGHTIDQSVTRDPSPNTSNSLGSTSPQGKNNKPDDPGNILRTKGSTHGAARFWEKVREAWKAVVRTLSLSLIVHAFQGVRHPLGRGLHEPTKIAVRHSRLIALLRNLVHLVPFGFALFEVILNWNVYYVGTEPYSTAVYQIIAKAHEVLIQASITTIIFSAIRRDLAHGKGLPFGLLFSGLQVSQLSYLWSVELWGAMRADFQRPLRKMGLFTLVVGGIMVAVASGPASAILLIPRVQLWPAGITHIWINATADQIWPARIDGTNIPETCSTVGLEASNVCPASEWYAVRDWLAVGTQMPSPSYQDRFRSGHASEIALLHGQSSTRNIYLGNALTDRRGPMPQVATTPQAVIADALTATASLWRLSLVNVTASAGHGSPLSDLSNSAHRIASNYSQPYSTAVCVPDQIKNESDSRKLAFPILPFTNPPSSVTRNQSYEIRGGSVEIIEHPYYSYYQLLDTPRDTQDRTLRWIELPGDLFNGSSIGAAILLPPHLYDSGYNVLLCNLAAGWSLSSLVVRSSPAGLGLAESTSEEGKKPTGQAVPISQSLTPRAYQSHETLGTVYDRPGFPNRSINISRSWAQYLDPSIEGFNTSLFNLLSRKHVEREDIGYETVDTTGLLVTLLLNGLARIGWGSTLQGEVRSVELNGEDGGLDGNYWLSGRGDVFENIDRTESQDWVTLRVDSSLEGYAYNTFTTPPRIAIAVLTAYCLLVAGHVLYTGVTGISSNCWDTIAEVTALAMNSSPTAALRNTCAGITELHIFKLPVRILVSKDEEGEGEHLELVFGTVDDEKMSERTIKANRTYGTLPRGVTEEGKKDI
ncbi:MAG: hypothetical protein Q9184_004957 [Pyrenodesmia sp. 2 TL-2023]